ncbi:hypothetical protein GCM10020000_39720 [Streptomyces olivoverticillatus]
MVLIGWATQSRMDKQWRLLSRLSGHFLDVVAGLPTLKVFGRAKAQAESIRVITSDYRRATLRTLRLAFLSSFALELLSTLSVALVAVGIGMRLVHGELDLATGLMVLVLAPEAYLPLRQVGAQYHAAAEGLAAADQVFAVLESELAPRREGPGARRPGRRPERRAARGAARGAHRAVAARGLPGDPARRDGGGDGRQRERQVDLAERAVGTRTADDRPGARRRYGSGIALPESWRHQVAWVPQRPRLFAGTVAENVRLARPEATDAQVREALRAAGALDFVTMLQDGTDTRLGEDGAGLSAGQRQRIALARAFLADRPVLLLDEPTAGLDGETEASVVEAVRRLAVGRTVVLVVHRPALLAVADRTVRLGSRPSGPGVLPADVPVCPQPRREAGEAPAVPRAVPGPGPARSSGVLARVRAAGRPWAPRFALALLLGALALGSAVGLMAVSGWLISRASQQPPVLYLMVAVTATRAFGIGRSVFRYAERLVSHDAVLRVLGGSARLGVPAAGAAGARRAAGRPARRPALPAGRGRGRAAGLFPALAAAVGCGRARRRGLGGLHGLAAAGGGCAAGRGAAAGGRGRSGAVGGRVPGVPSGSWRPRAANWLRTPSICCPAARSWRLRARCPPVWSACAVWTARSPVSRAGRLP